MKLSNKTYDILKQIVQIGLPAFITFYGVVANTWGWQYTEQILTTMIAVDTFLGAILGVSTLNYNKQEG